PLVPVDTEPREAVEDYPRVCVGAALAVGVLDAQQERSARFPREQPVEQRRARTTDVEVPGGAGSEADAGGGHGRFVEGRWRVHVPDIVRWAAGRRSPDVTVPGTPAWDRHRALPT